MKKFLIIIPIITLVAMAAFFGDEAYAQTKDLCGGTGGNGEIVPAWEAIRSLSS